MENRGRHAGARHTKKGGEPTVGATIVGGFLGVYGFNPMFVLITGSLGIMSASMPPPIDLVIITCTLIVMLSYIFAMLIAWRIRKITPRSLITE